MMPSRVSAPTPYTHFPLEELSNFPPTLGKNLIFKPVFPRFPIFWRVRCAQALASPRDLEGTRGCAKIVRTVWQSLVRIRPMAARLVAKPLFTGLRRSPGQRRGSKSLKHSAKTGRGDLREAQILETLIRNGPPEIAGAAPGQQILETLCRNGPRRSPGGPNP